MTNLLTALEFDEFVNGEVCKQASPFPVYAPLPGRFSGWFHSNSTDTLRGIANDVWKRYACGGFRGMLTVYSRSPLHLGSLRLMSVLS